MKVEVREFDIPEPVLQEFCETLAPHLRPVTTEAERAALAEALDKAARLIAAEAALQR